MLPIRTLIGKTRLNEIRRVLSPNFSVRLRWLNKCNQRLSLTSALWFSQEGFKFHSNSRTREELRDYFIQVSHFPPRKVKPGYNGKELVQNHTVRSGGGTHPSLTLFKTFLTTQIASCWFTHPFVYIFSPFKPVFCTYESRVLTYLLFHHQYSYLCRWHLSR